MKSCCSPNILIILPFFLSNLKKSKIGNIIPFISVVNLTNYSQKKLSELDNYSKIDGPHISIFGNQVVFDKSNSMDFSSFNIGILLKSHIIFVIVFKV